MAPAAPTGAIAEDGIEHSAELLEPVREGVSGVSFPGRTTNYPRDLTDAPSALIVPLLPKALPAGRPQSVNPHGVADPIPPVHRAGGPWRARPQDDGPWPTAYHSARAGRLDDTWQDVHDDWRGPLAPRPAASGRRAPSPPGTADRPRAEAVRRATTPPRSGPAASGPGAWAARSGSWR